VIFPLRLLLRIAVAPALRLSALQMLRVLVLLLLHQLHVQLLLVWGYQLLPLSPAGSQMPCTVSEQ
jgi:hypothetical protein